MKLSKAQSLIHNSTGGRLTLTDQGDRLIVHGEATDYFESHSACLVASEVKRRANVHIVNECTWQGKSESISQPKAPSGEPFNDKAIDGKSPDVLIIGGGVSGVMIARELSKTLLSVLLVDKENDFAMHSSGRNDGEVHPGVDLGKGSLKQHYVVLGNAMYSRLAEELEVPFSRVGQLVGFTNIWDKPLVRIFARQRRKIGVKDTQVISGKQIRRMFPHLAKNLKFGIWNACTGSVCPFELCIAAAENARENGVEFSLNTIVTGAEISHGTITSVHTNRGTVHPKVVINAAGTFSDIVAGMFGDKFFSIHPRKGSEAVGDKKAADAFHSIGSVRKSVITKNHTKGGGVLYTSSANMLLGPDAHECEEREDFSTQMSSIDEIMAKQQPFLPSLNKRDIITYFAGIRAATYEEDFIIERGRATANLVHCAGIQSPGLTSAPAFAPDVASLAKEVWSSITGKKVEANPKFNPKRKHSPVPKEMSNTDRDKLIKENPDYGKVICRCEEVTKGEIVDALKNPLCPPTIDGVKKRVRAGMGRCQGGFCMPLVMKIISEVRGIPLEEVAKAQLDSQIAIGESGKR